MVIEGLSLEWSSILWDHRATPFLRLPMICAKWLNLRKRVTRCTIKPLKGGVIVVFFRQNSVSIGELLQGMEQQLFGNENEQ